MDSRRAADSLFQRQQMELVWILVIGVAGMMTAFALVTAWERRRARMLKEAGIALGLRDWRGAAVTNSSSASPAALQTRLPKLTNRS